MACSNTPQPDCKNGLGEEVYLQPLFDRVQTDTTPPRAEENLHLSVQRLDIGVKLNQVLHYSDTGFNLQTT